MSRANGGFVVTVLSLCLLMALAILWRALQPQRAEVHEYAEFIK